MFTAKTRPNGELEITQHVGKPIYDESGTLQGMVYPELPEGAVRVTPPTDEITQHFRACWKLQQGAIVVDMAKAKAQHAAFIVTLIDERLQDIDAKTARAVRDAITKGDNSRVAQLESEAAALRLVRANPGVDSFTTPQTLAAYLPEELV